MKMVNDGGVNGGGLVAWLSFPSKLVDKSSTRGVNRCLALSLFGDRLQSAVLVGWALNTKNQLTVRGGGLLLLLRIIVIIIIIIIVQDK